MCVRAHFGDRPTLSRSAFAATVLMRAMVYCRLHVSDVLGFVCSCCVWSLLCAFVGLSVLFMYTREVFYVRFGTATIVIIVVIKATSIARARAFIS